MNNLHYVFSIFTIVSLWGINFETIQMLDH